MKAIDKVTKRIHAICPVFGGYQVCLFPNMEWEFASFSDVCVFTEDRFNAHFDLVKWNLLQERLTAGPGNRPTTRKEMVMKTDVICDGTNKNGNRFKVIAFYFLERLLYTKTYIYDSESFVEKEVTVFTDGTVSAQ